MEWGRRCICWVSLRKERELFGDEFVFIIGNAFNSVFE
jgi:hypothetical protein